MVLFKCTETTVTDQKWCLLVLSIETQSSGLSAPAATLDTVINYLAQVSRITMGQMLMFGSKLSLKHTRPSVAQMQILASGMCF